MASFSTDFHANRDELIQLVSKWMKEHSLQATACLFPPARAISLTDANLRQVLELPDAFEVIFTDGLVGQEAQHNTDILRQYPDALSLYLGFGNDRGVEQSILRTLNANERWKKLNRELKKMTTAGAECVWEDGRKAHDRNARFTAGAKALAASGVPLRQFAQSDFVYMPK